MALRAHLHFGNTEDPSLGAKAKASAESAATFSSMRLCLGKEKMSTAGSYGALHTHCATALCSMCYFVLPPAEAPDAKAIVTIFPYLKCTTQFPADLFLEKWYVLYAKQYGITPEPMFFLTRITHMKFGEEAESALQTST